MRLIEAVACARVTDGRCLGRKLLLGLGAFCEPYAVVGAICGAFVAPVDSYDALFRAWPLAPAGPYIALTLRVRWP